MPFSQRHVLAITQPITRAQGWDPAAYRTRELYKSLHWTTIFTVNR